jgi:hypothetical protein
MVEIDDPWTDYIEDSEVERCAEEMPEGWRKAGPLGQFLWMNLRPVAKPSGYPYLHQLMTGVCPLATSALLKGKKACLLRLDQVFAKTLLS